MKNLNTFYLKHKPYLYLGGIIALLIVNQLAFLADTEYLFGFMYFFVLISFEIFNRIVLFPKQKKKWAVASYVFFILSIISLAVAWFLFGSLLGGYKPKTHYFDLSLGIAYFGIPFWLGFCIISLIITIKKKS